MHNIPIFPSDPAFHFPVKGDLAHDRSAKAAFSAPYPDPSGLCGLGVFLFRVVLPCTLPFWAGLVIAFLLKPVTAALTRLLGLHRRGAALFAVTLFYLLLAGLLWAAVWVAGSGLYRLALSLPELVSQDVLPSLGHAAEELSRLCERMLPASALDPAAWPARLPAGAQEAAGALSARLLDWTGQAVSAVPFFLLTVLFTVLSSVFISLDYTQVACFLLRQLPPAVRAAFFECKDFLSGTLLRLARAYLVLFLLTWAQLWLGLWLLGVTQPLGAAALTALLDALPILGTGIILLPWSALSLLRGKLALAAGLLLLYGIVLLVRNLLEPRIVGKSIGLHPLVTTLAMYAGLRLGGVVGLALAPCSVLLLQFLNETGLIRLYKE